MTLRPSVESSQAGLSVVGAASRLAALNDASDSSYVRQQTNGVDGNGRYGFAGSGVVAGVVRAVTWNVRYDGPAVLGSSRLG